MTLWSHLQISRRTWKALCHRQNNKKSTSTDPAQLSSKYTVTTSTNPGESGLATAQSGTALSTAPSSSISSESSLSSPTNCASLSKSSSILPTSTSSLISTNPTPPPGEPHNHKTYIPPTHPLTSRHINHITSTCYQARSQHDHLAPPLQQLLQACRPRSCSLDGPYPALDVSTHLSNVHTQLLHSVLEVVSKLSQLGTSIRRLDDTVGKATLAMIEREIEDVKVWIRRLRRFEERIKRYLRVQAGSGAARLEVIVVVRDRFSPEMREFICGMDLLSVRICFAELQVRSVARPGERV